MSKHLYPRLLQAMNPFHHLNDRRSFLKGVSLGTGGLLLAPLLQKIAAAADGNVTPPIAPPIAPIAPKYVPVKWDEKEAKKLQSEWAAKLKVEVETKTSNGIVMVLIPPAGAALPKPYWLGKYELTQAEWEGVMGYNLSGFKKGSNKEAEGMDTSRFPVTSVSWYDSLEFCNKLSEKEGLPPYYELKVIKRKEEKHPGIVQAEVKLLGGNGYKMPTEFEWEHGGRAGTTTAFYFGDNEEDLVEYGWIGKNSGMRPHPVGEKKPNAFGLHDVHGNLREWVVETLARDDFSALSRDRAVSPLRGMNRGGGYEYTAKICRFFESRRHGPWDRLHFAGFRLARETGD